MSKKQDPYERMYNEFQIANTLFKLLDKQREELSKEVRELAKREKLPTLSFDPKLIDNFLTRMQHGLREFNRNLNQLEEHVSIEPAETATEKELEERIRATLARKKP